jgi:hypothetical protein
MDNKELNQILKNIEKSSKGLAKLGKTIEDLSEFHKEFKSSTEKALPLFKAMLKTHNELSKIHEMESEGCVPLELHGNFVDIGPYIRVTANLLEKSINLIETSLKTLDPENPENVKFRDYLKNTMGGYKSLKKVHSDDIETIKKTEKLSSFLYEETTERGAFWINAAENFKEGVTQAIVSCKRLGILHGNNDNKKRELINGLIKSNEA